MRLNRTPVRTERIEAGMRAGNLSWWELELPFGNVFFDDRKAEMLGYPPENLRTYEDFTALLHPDDYEPAMQAMRDHLAGTAKKYEVKYRIQTSDGTYMWFRDVGGITERKHAQEGLREALAQKDQLMREMNHRVKNSLHMALSLLRLKDDTTGDEVDLSDVYFQIKAIARIHQKLHQGGGIRQIDFGSYVKDLLSHVFSVYSGAGVAVSADAHGIMLPTDTATHIGLIVTELATNAMKYGFDTDMEKPRFTVELTRENDSYVLTVSNTGRPFPEDIQLDNPQTLGLQLVSALVAQVAGTVDLKRKPHSVFTIRFPVSVWTP